MTRPLSVYDTRTNRHAQGAPITDPDPDVCSWCGGIGRIPASTCPDCGGDGTCHLGKRP